MTAMALIASAVLVVLAAIHVMWALGLWWPIRDEAALARAVVGQRGVTRMPGAVPSALMAVALVFAAAWPWLPASGLRTGGLVLAALAFQVRAVFAYSPWAQSLTPEQPFRRLDETRYAPLSGALGMIYLVLAATTTEGL